mmetsp:Transcript_46069/g.130257  ORF Transcript_46069/g.130257 Transcript_46069/m.130257 type:complete len:351 (-) Transcript_46069:43-1095(-)
MPVDADGDVQEHRLLPAQAPERRELLEGAPQAREGQHGAGAEDQQDPPHDQHGGAEVGLPELDGHLAVGDVVALRERVHPHGRVRAHLPNLQVSREARDEVAHVQAGPVHHVPLGDLLLARQQLDEGALPVQGRWPDQPVCQVVQVQLVHGQHLPGLQVVPGATVLHGVEQHALQLLRRDAAALGPLDVPPEREGLVQLVEAAPGVRHRELHGCGRPRRLRRGRRQRQGPRLGRAGADQRPWPGGRGPAQDQGPVGRLVDVVLPRDRLDELVLPPPILLQHRVHGLQLRGVELRVHGVQPLREAALAGAQHRGALRGHEVVAAAAERDLVGAGAAAEHRSIDHPRIWGRA